MHKKYQVRQRERRGLPLVEVIETNRSGKVVGTDYKIHVERLEDGSFAFYENSLSIRVEGLPSGSAPKGTEPKDLARKIHQMIYDNWIHGIDYITENNLVDKTEFGVPQLTLDSN